MGITLLLNKVGVECNNCRFERWWPRATNHVTLNDVQAQAAGWGWTFNGRDLCDDCTRKLKEDA